MLIIFQIDTLNAALRFNSLSGVWLYCSLKIILYDITILHWVGQKFHLLFSLFLRNSASWVPQFSSWLGESGLWGVAEKFHLVFVSFILYCSLLFLPSEVLPHNANMYKNTVQDEVFWRGSDLEFLFVNVCRRTGMFSHVLLMYK